MTYSLATGRYSVDGIPLTTALAKEYAASLKAELDALDETYNASIAAARELLRCEFRNGMLTHEWMHSS